MKALVVNLRNLERHDVELAGDLPAADLGLEGLDELVRVAGPVHYELQVQKMEKSLLVQGLLEATLDCECARCLKSFAHVIRLPSFAVDIELEGEGSAQDGDFVDLTPFVREDMVLAFPQHPLCEPGCAGLQQPASAGADAPPGKESQMTSSVWAVLNKLKL